METQENGHTGTNVKETNNSKSGKAGILKEQSGNENIPDLDENKQLIDREPIPNSPFELIGNEQVGYWASMGLFRLNAPTRTKEETIEIIEERGWEILINVICGIMAGRDMEIMKQAEKKQYDKPNN